MSPYAPPRAILRVLSDERLARHAAGGSEQAFSILYDRHARDLLAACRAIVRDDDDARDALQSTMLNAWRAIGRRDDAPVRPWLFRIARNEAITVLRRRRPSAELHENAGTRPDLHEEAAGRAELAGVLDGIDDLSERQREALVLRTLGDAGYDEIALMHATSPEAVRQSVAHARRTLRRRRLAGLIPVPAWLADLAASAGTTGAPAIQAGFAKTAVGVTAAVAAVGGAVGPASLPRHAEPERAAAASTGAARTTHARHPVATASASAALAPVAPAAAALRPATSPRSSAAPARRRASAPRRVAVLPAPGPDAGTPPAEDERWSSDVPEHRRSGPRHVAHRDRPAGGPAPGEDARAPERSGRREPRWSGDRPAAWSPHPAEPPADAGPAGPADDAVATRDEVPPPEPGPSGGDVDAAPAQDPRTGP